MTVLTLEQLKKLPSKPGIPRSHWNATGGTRGTGMKSGGELREKLVEGMDEKEIDKLAESPQGEAVMNEYLNDRQKRGKMVEDKSNGVYNEETPKGEMAREFVFDKKGKMLPEKTYE